MNLKKHNLDNFRMKIKNYKHLEINQKKNLMEKSQKEIVSYNLYKMI